MKEDFIHFLWKYRLFQSTDLKTTRGESLQIVTPGIHNKDAGPDFFAAKMYIDQTLWVGNVEIHINSSDWCKHGHQNDEAYGNIILHVVINHNQEIKDKNQNAIPVLDLSSYFDKNLLGKYEKIINSKTWIPCEKEITHVNPLIITNWLSRLLVERLENKSDEILKFLRYFEDNWEQTFYYFLARNFGFKVNASPFALVAQKTPYKVLARHKFDITQLEAILFGQAGMLDNKFNEAYPTLLQKEYSFMQHKYNLQSIDKTLWKMGKLRPGNFPGIRIAQFAMLIHKSSALFSKIIEAENTKEIYKLFDVQCSPYWNNHYVFDKESVKRSKTLGKSAIENLIINTIVPLKFVYGMQKLKPDVKEQAIQLLHELPSEQNTLLRKWEQTGIAANNAAEGQALLELKKYYCTPKKCLNCSIGHFLIRQPASA